MESKTKRKLVATGVATATTAALLLTGTYAWQSISQQALNAASDSINPGGRLHDDFNGTDKRIYVENFADDEIYARIRLSEYMELGRDAGVDVGTENRKVTIVTENASYDDKATWQVHYYDQANATDEYWTWEMTGDGVPYMPTFNKDKDSLTADINGTYEQNYEDYVDYSLEENESKIANARYDIDTDDIDEDKDGEGAVEGEDIEYIEETHTVKMTSSSCIMTMEEWGLLEDSEKEATECWIYDIDGWAYWSKPIKGGETTGTILRSIAVKNVDDNWYYAINAEAQFVTADDLGYSDNTGFYTDANSAPTAEALELLKYIGVTVEEAVEEPTLSDEAIALATTIANTPVGETVLIENDGENITTPSYYVIAKEDNKALLMYYRSGGGGGNGLHYSFDETSNNWETSSLRAELNSTENTGFLADKTVLNEIIMDTTLYTRDPNNIDEYIVTTDRVFIMSEADRLGTIQGTAVSYTDSPNDYLVEPGTDGNIIPDEITITGSGINFEDDYMLLRTPGADGNIRYASTRNGGTHGEISPSTSGTIMPMFWVDISSSTSNN